MYILGPFFIACTYPILKRFSLLTSPYLVIPASILGGLCLFLLHEGMDFHYSHFLLAPVYFLALYLPALRIFGYARVDSVAISVMAVYAADQLWQFPIYFTQWRTPEALAIGLTSAGFNLMSLPLLFAFILRAKGRLKFKSPTILAFILLSITEVLMMLGGMNLSSYFYYIMPLGILFFGALIRDSSLVPSGHTADIIAHFLPIKSLKRHTEVVMKASS